MINMNIISNTYLIYKAFMMKYSSNKNDPYSSKILKVQNIVQ